jgi:predicted PurR-regulated permease PerM
MKYHYSASDFVPNEVLVGNKNNFISTYPSKEDLLNLKQNVELLANDTSKDLNALQSEINRNKVIADEQIEKLQKELQEFKKAANEFQRHLIGTSITLSVAIVFILILICFYYK